MANTLDAITLPDGLLWTDYDQWATRLRVDETDVNGAPVIFQQTVSKGRPITLVAGPVISNGNNTVFTRAQRDAIQAKSDSAGPFTLTWLSVPYSVDFVAVPEWQLFMKAYPGGVSTYEFFGTLRFKVVA